MQKYILSAVTLTASVTSSLAISAPVKIQPDESASKDTWAYSFTPFLNRNYNSGTFAPFLLTNNSGGAGHDMRTYVQFDLPTGTAVDATEFATLNLYVQDGASLGFVNNPTPSTEVTVSVFAVTSVWDENTLTWAQQPTASTTPLATLAVNGVNRWASFDITSAVQGWLAAPATNFGLVLRQQNSAGSGFTAPVFTSSASTIAENRPFFEIAVVPEPTTGLLVAGAVMFVGRRRR